MIKKQLTGSRTVINQTTIAATSSKAVLKKECDDLVSKARAYDILIGNKNMSLHVFCRRLPGVNSNKIYSDLHEMGYLYKTQGIYRVYSKYRDRFFSEQYSPAHGKQEIAILEQGKRLLMQLYLNGKLTMKKGYANISAKLPL